MDPDVLLANLLDLARKVNDPTYEVASGIEAAEDLAVDIENLDEWITHGGFVPERWSAATVGQDHQLQLRTETDDWSTHTQTRVYCSCGSPLTALGDGDHLTLTDLLNLIIEHRIAITKGT